MSSENTFFGSIPRPIITIVSMLLFTASFAWILNWPTAAVVTLLLFVHEMGHVWFARWRGVDVSIPVFIPFLGAFISVRSGGFKTPQDEAWLGIGGPLVGGFAAILLLPIVGTFFPNSLSLGTAVYIGLFINLFNMLPIRPLDGGRVTQVIGKWTQAVGLITLLLATMFLRNPILLLIFFFALMEFGRSYPAANVSLKERIVWGVGYIALATILAGVMFVAPEYITLPSLTQ